MQSRLAAGVLVALLALFAGCRDAPGPDTKVLGSHGQPAASSGSIAAPKLPPGIRAQVVQAADGSALAAWVQDERVHAASYARGTGWTAPQVLEDIHGQASDVQLAADRRGTAMAIWRHTVGSIQSLRYSRFDSAGWSVPDVMPGALPRAQGSPELEMDAEGNAQARWPSGFDEHETQTARYVPGQGWSRALSEPLSAAAPSPRPATP